MTFLWIDNCTEILYSEAMTTNKASAQELRESVQDYRNPTATAEERAEITRFWSQNQVTNQFAALLLASELSHKCD